MYKKFISSLIFLSFILVGCTSTNTNSPASKSPSASGINVSGRWKWYAKKDTKLIAEGQLELKDNNGNIEGNYKVNIPNKLVPGREKKVGLYSVKTFFLTGKRDQFKIYLNAQNDVGEVFIKKVGFISEDGRLMSGKGLQIVVSKTPIYTSSMDTKGKITKKDLGKTYNLEYEWKAYRF